ncbi:MAG: type II toxin-antitoxin system VapB family antitoxin [Dehalococcoidia bacterium]
MRTTIEIDDTLMREAQEALGQATKKATIDFALRTALRLKRQEEILGLVDRDTFWPGYDPEEGEPDRPALV